MFELIFLAVALIGSSLAAAWDLKTTEIPDEIPHTMIALALILFSFQSVLEHNYWLVLNSLIVGGSLLGIGFLMYYFGQWGGGDAKILASIGFLLPTFSSKLLLPFPISYLINVFLVGAIYMIFYAFVIAALNKKIIFQFSKDVRASINVVLLGSIALFIFFLAINWYLMNSFQIKFDLTSVIQNSVFPLFLTLGLFFLWRFAKAVEEVGFKKTIPVSKLKVGDVLLENRLWEGITEKQLKKIKQSGKRTVVIKEGVRFAPAFPLALIFTIYFGDGLLFLIKYFL
jgi:Flp pilus assembly protein protease CpaA